MSAAPLIVDNVWAFLDRVDKDYARMEADRFRQEMHANCLELGMQSPIEHLFWIAATVLAKSQYTIVNPEPFEVRGEWHVGSGLFISPQHKVSKYTVDFLLYQNGIGPDEILTPVVVELDGHDFHDRDKNQRSYEKARDRHLVKTGFRVIHFTGSDVVKDPFACAFEALEMLGVYAGTGIRSYDKSNPLGLTG
jgi:very-short-patch-repair endonuclease